VICVWHITSMHGNAICCVRSHDQSIWKKVKFDPQYIQTPPRLYAYVAELSCCAKSEQNWLTQFYWRNRGSLGFFSHTHAISESNKISFISSTDHKYGRISNVYGSNRAASRPDVPFGGIVDSKARLVSKSPKTEFSGSDWAFQA